MINRITEYIKVDLWRIRTRELTPRKAFGVKFLRVIILSIQDFIRDNCTLRASALTYYTLLTIVPVLAMAFGIAQGFGFEKTLQKQILTQFKGQEEAINQIFFFVNVWLERTKGGLIAGIGVVLLLYYVIRILSNIEHTLNTIWQVEVNRKIVRKLTDYITLMIMGPLFAILSGSLTVYITTTVQKITQSVEMLEKVSPLIDTPLKIIPYAMIWLLLTFIYIILPNTRVKFIPALIGGVVAGTAYQITQWGYINFQIVVSNINAIYGSFAALPLFLIWVQLSWTIILFGAEISYAVQTIDEHEQNKDIAKMSQYYKKILTLYLLHLIVKRFANEKQPLTKIQLSNQLDLPITVVEELLEDLRAAKIVSTTKLKSGKALCYQPARDIQKLSTHYILNLLEKTGVNQIKMDDTNLLSKIERAMHAVEEAGEKSEGNVLLKDL